MKQLAILTLSLLLFSVAAIANADINFVQQNNTNGGSGARGSLGVAMGSNVTAGNVLFTCINHETNGSVSSIVDNQGNTWTKRASVANGTSIFMEEWTAVVGSTGALNATATYSTNLTWSNIGILEYSGFTTPTFLTAATGTNTGTTATVATTTVNSVPALMVGCQANFSGTANPFTADAAYTQRYSVNANDVHAAQDATTTTAGLGWNMKATFLSSNKWVDTMVVFYDNASAPTSSPSVRMTFNWIND